MNPEHETGGAVATTRVPDSVESKGATPLTDAALDEILNSASRYDEWRRIADHARKMERERDFFTTCGIVELAIRNINVKSYVGHWEGRALKAERDRTDLLAALESLLLPEGSVSLPNHHRYVVAARDAIAKAKGSDGVARHPAMNNSTAT